MTSPNPRPNMMYEWKGHATSQLAGATQERQCNDLTRRTNLLPDPRTERPRLKRYLSEQAGPSVANIWTDIDSASTPKPPNVSATPHKSPLALLERIIQASSNPGDVVLDPFCGCGTTIAAAQKLGRRWIGIDITHLAIALQKYRLQEMFPGAQVRRDRRARGPGRSQATGPRRQVPVPVVGAVADQGSPVGGDAGSKTGKKGADQGIDGVITFIDDASSKPKRAIVQVKSGHVTSQVIRDLRGTIEREQAAIGVLITLEPATKAMETEAVSAGFYESPGWGKSYPRLQILTIEQLLHGAQVQMPPAYGTFKQAAKVKAGSSPEQPTLGL